MIFLLCLGLVAVGIYAVLAKTNVVKIVLGLLVIEHGVRLMLVAVGYRTEGVPPILSAGSDPAVLASTAVDPLPQALVLTAIVIGFGMTAFLLVLALRALADLGTDHVDGGDGQR